ncbi:MAG: glycosyltransferase [Planctomycetota bacterium]
MLLRALALLPPGERPPLVLVGRDAGAGPRLRALADDLGIATMVTSPASSTTRRSLNLGATARAIVVPSRYESFGFAALDGLARGRPTLVAAAGALPEVVGNAGVVLPADDPAAWAQAIAATRDDAPGAAAARRAAAAHHGWEDAAARLVGLWRRLNAPGG